MEKRKRALSENAVRKEKIALDVLNSYIEVMSPYQLELLSDFAYKIVSGKKLNI